MGKKPIRFGFVEALNRDAVPSVIATVDQALPFEVPKRREEVLAGAAEKVFRCENYSGRRLPDPGGPEHRAGPGSSASFASQPGLSQLVRVVEDPPSAQLNPPMPRIVTGSRFRNVKNTVGPGN